MAILVARAPAFVTLVLTTVCLSAHPHPASAQSPSRPLSDPVEVRAVRITAPISLDGRLDEPIWQSAPAVVEFRQSEPAEGALPTERTEVRLAYDDEALYVGARMYDSDPGAVVARLGRRDASLKSDDFILYLDPYHDRRTGFLFSINAAGTLGDGVLYNDGWDDHAWDGVWDGRAQVDALGWTAEMRIPYSQLRFHRADQPRWGINACRHIARKNEDDYLAYTPKKASGFVSRFLDLVGLEDVRPPRHLAVAPYARASAEYRPPASTSLDDRSRYRPTLGADLKMGLGSSLTLDAAVNPDFGQVEVDPAVVNLTDLETFYPEKRPFFLEGASIFQFGSGGATNFVSFDWSNPELFYSRRIGRAPQGSAMVDGGVAEVPAGVTILGAAKVTGKIGDHWNVGLLHAVTGQAEARVRQDGISSRQEVEPGTYYGVFRAQRDTPQNRYGLGLLGTVVERRLQTSPLRDQLGREALALGLDGWAFLDEGKTWVLTGWTAASRVAGTAAQIDDLQRRAPHYFQRPDREHALFDPSARSLSGLAGRYTLNKERGNLLVNAALGFVTPGFEVNDLGFLGRTDTLTSHLWGRYRWTTPGRFTRSASLDAAVVRTWDLDGDPTANIVYLSGGGQLRSYHRIAAWVAKSADTLNPSLTRGGPLTLNPRGWEADLSARSDDRRRLVLDLDGHWADERHGAWHSTSVSLGAEWKPRPNIALGAHPQVEWSRNGAQWLAEIPDPLATATYGRRYVFAPLDQTTVSTSLRLNWTFTPRLSLELFVQPLLSAGDYHERRALLRPRSFDFVPYEGGSAANPDFDVQSLRGNAVLRWEYRPGSTVYVVWTQTRADDGPSGDFRLDRSLSHLLGSPADNIFLVKLSYWWSR